MQRQVSNPEAGGFLVTEQYRQNCTVRELNENTMNGKIFQVQEYIAFSLFLNATLYVAG